MKTRRGFTLVEVLIVITIITLLMSGLVVLIRGMIDRARYAKTTAIIKAMDMGCQNYKVDYGIFPRNDMGDSRCLHRYLGSDRLIPAQFSTSGSQPMVRKPPIVEFKLDWLDTQGGQSIDPADGGPAPILDAWGQVIRYANPGVRNKQGVDIWSLGKDGAGDTNDEVQNWAKEY